MPRDSQVISLVCPSGPTWTRADATPASICEKFGFKLRVEVVGHGGCRQELLHGNKFLFMIRSPHPRRPLPEEAPHLHRPRSQVREEVPQLIGET